MIHTPQLKYSHNLFTYTTEWKGGDSYDQCVDWDCKFSLSSCLCFCVVCTILARLLVSRFILPTGFSALSCVYCLMSLVTSLSNVIYSNGLIFVFPGTNLNIMTLILFVSHARLFGFLTLSLRTSKAVTKSRILYFPYLQCHCTVFCYCCCFCIKLGINSFCSFYLISAALMASLMWPTTPMCWSIARAGCTGCLLLSIAALVPSRSPISHLIIKTAH